MPAEVQQHFKMMDCYLDEGDPSSVDFDDFFYCSAEPLLSDDIWKKFELDFPELTDAEFNIFDELDGVLAAVHQHQSGLSASLSSATSPAAKECEIRNHDCMWAGHCGSKEHPADEANKPPLLLLPHHSRVFCNNKNNNPNALKNNRDSAPGSNNNNNERTTPASRPQLQPVPAGCSLLLKAAPKNAAPAYPQTQLVQSPESPPMSDDEEAKATTTLQLLKEAIAECDIEEDSDLCDYFDDDGCDDDGDEDDFAIAAGLLAEQKHPQSYQQRARTMSTHYVKDNSNNDHCYHKDKTAAMRTRSLGIETPSDSEEEIDVVSVNEKLTGRMVYSLPTNPSSQDRQKLQRTVASAISNKHINNGIKTVMSSSSPMRKLTVTDQHYNNSVLHHHQQQQQSPVKRKMITEFRGMKRTKRQRGVLVAGAGSPCKRRMAYGHSSDSDQEPSEKRNLHNNMERQRRIDLRNAFEDLRLLVPAVNQKERAAKVAILREAANYCDDLGAIHADKLRQVDELRRQQERLRARVSQLRRSLAAKR